MGVEGKLSFMYKKALKNISNRPTDRSIQKLRKDIQYPYCRFVKGPLFSVEVLQKDYLFWQKMEYKRQGKGLDLHDW